MRQLPLEVGPADYAVFDSYFAGPNAALLHALQELARMRSRAVLWLWGPAQSGRSHLLQATVHAADRSGARAAYLPLDPALGLHPSALDGMGELDLLCLDDVDRVAGQPDWERALLMVFEGLRQRGSRLVMSARVTALHAGFALPDLTSRFTSGATFRMQPLDDDEKVAALQARATWRGLELPADTAAFLISRVDRSAGALFELLDRLDRAALAAQKRLTIPFVRSVLEHSAD